MLQAASKRVLIFSRVFLLLQTTAFSQVSTEDRALLFQVEKRYLASSVAGKVHHFFEDIVIEEPQKIDGDLVVLRGDATIRGEVYGQVVAVFGDVFVESTGAIEGNAISIDGKVWLAKGAWVKGEVIETAASRIAEQVPEEPNTREEPLGPQWLQERPRRDYWRNLESRWLLQPKRDFILARYNRVEGGFLGVQWPTERHFHRLDLFGEIGYGFQSKQWRYELGGQFLVFDHFGVGGSYHDLTDTQDAWVVPLSENNVTALFFKKDFRDYYRRRGFSLFARQKFSPAVGLKVEFRNDEYFNMPTVTNWALFRGESTFRINPPIDEGSMHSVRAHLEVDTRYDSDFSERGWYLSAIAEFAGRALGGVFDFDRYVLDIRRFQPLSHKENLDFRVRVGTSRGSLPQQFWFDLGGISSLPGYDFKEFTGSRLILANIEYRVDGRGFLDDVWFLHPFVDPFSVIVFVDTGWAWFASQGASAATFDNFRVSDLKTDVGFAIADRDGDFRLNISQRLDGGGGLNIALRVSRPF